MHRQIAGKLTSPVTKWVVLVAAVVLTGILGTLGGKLADVKNNEQSSWVPSSAESTRVSDQLSKEIDPNDIPTLVAYHRAGGLTEADLAAIEEQGAEIAKIDGITGQGVLTPSGAAALAAQGGNAPTLLSDDGEVAYVYFTFNLGKDGWNKIKEPVEEIKKITDMDGVDVYVGGFGGQAYDFISSFDGSHVTLLLMTFGVVILILLFTYRSPIALDPPDRVRVRRQHHGRRRGLPDGEVRRARRQRPEPIHPQHPGHRRRHRLRPAPRREISRRAPSPRRPARGDGVRVASRRAGDHRQRRDRRGRAHVPLLRRPQLDGQPGAGARRRRGRDPAGDGHPAARPPGDPRPVDLLAGAADLRLRRAHPDRPVGARR